MRQKFLVCYDVRDSKRLQRVYRLLKSWGIHLQYSVFFCNLNRNEIQALMRELEGIIEAGEDDIRFYPLPSKPQIEILGCGDRVPEGVEIFI